MAFGIWPTNPLHLLGLLVPLPLWVLKRQAAQERHTTIWHSSGTLAVPYWEELLFRGALWSVILAVWDNAFAAFIGTSILFGLFHLRNRWWATRKQLLQICVTTTLAFAPLVSLIRWWSGDIYLGIALHALWNFAGMYVPRSSAVPTDEYLHSKEHRMNRFEKVFSGFWLRSHIRWLR